MFHGALRYVQIVEFVQLLLAKSDMNWNELRKTWQDETDWLNEKGGVSAVLKEGDVENDHVEMCIAMKRLAT